MGFRGLSRIDPYPGWKIVSCTASYSKKAEAKVKIPTNNDVVQSLFSTTRVSLSQLHDHDSSMTFVEPITTTQVSYNSMKQGISVRWSCKRNKRVHVLEREVDSDKEELDARGGRWGNTFNPLRSHCGRKRQVPNPPTTWQPRLTAINKGPDEWFSNT